LRVGFGGLRRFAAVRAETAGIGASRQGVPGGGSYCKHKSPPPGTPWREAAMVERAFSNTMSAAAEGRPGRTRRAYEVPRSAGLVAAREARFVIMLVAMFERNERSE
jgi:hypothetical protein